MVSVRGNLRQLPCAGVLAYRVRAPGLRWEQGVVLGAPSGAMRRMPATDLRDRGHDSRRYSEAVARIVPGHVVCDEPEVGRGRIETPPASRPGSDAVRDPEDQ